MKSILHISRTMGQGGAEQVVYQLATSLTDEFENIIIASTGGQKVSDLEENGVNHINIEDIESKNLFKIIKNIQIFIRCIQRYRITHVHSHHRMGLLYCQLIRRIYPNIRFYYTAHNIFSNNNNFYKILIKNVNIIAVGESVKQHLINDVKVNNNINVIYNGVSDKNNKIQTDDVYTNYKGIKILCVARLSEQKGIKYLLRSLKNINSNSYKLFIIGEGELLEELQKLVLENDLDKKVEFLGYKNNVHEYIKECDFMVLPSLWEGFPLTPIECFMNKKTIIATNIPGTNEIVNGNNGILVEAKNPEELSNAINYLLENPHVVTTKSEIAFQTYIESFSYDVFLNSYRELYNKV